LKGCKVAIVADLDGLLDAMVARDEDWVRPTHQGNGLAAVAIVQPCPPIGPPLDHRCGLVEQGNEVVVVAAFQRVGKMAEHESEFGLAIGKGAFKLTINGPKTTAQVMDDAFPVSFVLHDLGKDIEETTDVSRNHPAMVKEMHALLKKYVREGRSNGRR